LLTGLAGAAGGVSGFRLSNVLGQMNEGLDRKFGVGFFLCSGAVALDFAALICLGPFWPPDGFVGFGRSAGRRCGPAQERKKKRRTLGGSVRRFTKSLQVLGGVHPHAGPPH